MAYEKHDWSSGEVITESLLDNMEDGIEAAHELAEAAQTTADEALATAEEIADSYINQEIELDGTADGYKLAMYKWFIAKGAADATAEELTALCDEWYSVTRDTWNGYVTFYQPDVSAVTTGTKGGDNADLTCEASTDTTEGQDDYAGLPLFACVDCNWEMYTDDDGNIEPLITAIEGINDSFTRTDTSIYVGVLQMSGWHYWEEDDETYTHGYAALRSTISASNVEPLAEAVKQDGSIREWVLHAKYMSGLVDSKMTSCSGVIPKTYSFSHNTIHTYSANNGSYYSGTCACDDAFLKLMFYIKYASLASDGIIQGCCNMNYQYPALVAEEGVKRVLIDSSYSSYFETGMSVLIGDYSSNDASTDRSKSSMYSISGNSGLLVTSIKTVTVDDTDYTAIYVKADDTFDTGANGSATDGTTYISSFHWPTGTTDSVLGNDGSPTSNTSGKYPAKIQGIEYMNGCYEIVADSILSLYVDDAGDYWYEPYVCDTRANQTTSISDNYTASGAACEQQSSDSWYYTKKLSLSGGVMFPIEVGGSSSTYTRDGFYQNTSVTGTREWLARGALSHGVANPGLSCVHGHAALSASYWYYGARLSSNGSRGEFTA